MNDSLKAQCIAEFLGTGLFLFFGIGCLSALKVAGASLGLWEICIIWGLGISLAVYLTAGISGAHLNPAITVALAICLFPGTQSPALYHRAGCGCVWRRGAGLSALWQFIHRVRNCS